MGRAGRAFGIRNGAGDSTPAAGAPNGAVALLAGLWAAQRARWVLWLPVAAIAGAAAWLTAPETPPAWIAPGALVAGALLGAAVAIWPRPARRQAFEFARALIAGLCAIAAFAGLGACAAQLRTAFMGQAPLAGEIGPVLVEGWVEEVEIGTPRTRMRLLVHSIEGVPAPPRYVRVSSPGVRAFSAGRAIRCRAVLRAPDGPLAPGAYDFARRAFFERLGATGFTLGRCRPVLLPPPSWFDAAMLRLAAIRADLAETIHNASPGPGGAVAASLIVGDRSLIAEEVNVDLRDSGLGHILSVSGLHMGVVGGLTFAAFTGFFALIAPLALRFSVKKLAAIGALTVLSIYLVISGASVPAIRAYVMAAVAFGAILVDRPAISMRGLVLAALIIVLAFPESVLEPGFQMSFAATAALVAAFEVAQRDPSEARLPTPGPLVGGLQMLGRGIGGVLLISFVAGLATDPFALYHFQRFAVYGLPANLVAAPLVSFVIAPAAALAALAAPFGLAEWPLQIMASACDFLVGIGRAFADRPEAVHALPRPSDVSFLAAVAAILWGCLWSGALRWGAVPFLAFAATLYATTERPILFFDGELRAVLARDETNDWILIRPHGRSTFARDRLAAMAGIAPSNAERLAQPEECSEDLCLWRSPRGQRLAVALSDEGARDPRLAGALILTRESAAPRTVVTPRLLIDARDLAEHGGGYVVETPRGLAVTRVRTHAQARPWIAPMALAD